LKEAICRKFKQDNGLLYTPNQIIVSNGAKHSLYNIFQAILNPGDEVLIPSPYWLSYPEMIKMADGVPIFINTNEDDSFKPTADNFAKSITSKTKAIIINSPNNPTGAVYDEKELSKIAEIALNHNLYIISDEIYEDLIYDDIKHVSIASLGEDIKKLTLTVNGMSKSFAMPGWRIGYTAGRQDIIDVMTNIQSHSTSNPNSIAQYAATAALNSPKDSVIEMAGEFKNRRSFMVERINSLPLVTCTMPKGAFYVMMNIEPLFGKCFNGFQISDSLSFAEVLLDEARVAVVPGIVFGADEYVRLSYASSMENISKGLDRIERFLEKLI